jgi:hypothetical protein
MLGAEPPRALPDGLTPGDVAAVRLRRDLMGGADAATLRAWLAECAEVGGALRRDVGFRVVGTAAARTADLSDRDADDVAA